MKKLKIFYLESCPYCVKAKKAMRELTAENPAFAEVEAEWIEESRRPDIADRYDYYYVPCIFSDDVREYECSPGDDYAEIKRRFELALKAATGG